MADRLGTRVGNYRLSQLLGRGGFAEVYLGVHVHLGTQAAVKLLHTSLASAGEIEKFREEARLIATLQHPHILRVLEFGIDAGQPYLVLEHAPGGSLRECHPAGIQVPLATVVSYVQQIAQALQFAHDQKLIHRDIKPQNLLIGRNEEILLSDFGISVVAESTSRQAAQGFAGTVAYSAPEQLQEHPRPASDQYALGVVVYEWLTGTVPFTGAFQEIIAKQLFVAPPPLREHLKSLPAAVEEVVLTALAKDPKARFASVSAFARALEQASTLATPTLPVMAPAHSQPPSGGTPASMQAPHSPGGALTMTEVPPAATPNVLLPTKGQPAALAESAPAATDSARALPEHWQQVPAPPAPLVSTRTLLPPPLEQELAAPAPARPGETSSASPTNNLSTPAPSSPASVRVARWGALAGVVGPLFFLADFTLVGFLQPGYSPVRQPVSDLGVGPTGWIFDGPAFLTGLLLLAFALGFAPLMGATLSPGKRWLCAALLALPGLGYLIASLFTLAPATAHIHLWLGAALAFFGPVVAFFVIGLVLRDQAGWQGWSTYSVLASVATLGLAFFTFVSFPGFPNAAAQISGLVERLLFLEISAWYVACGWRLWVGRGSSHEAGNALASLWIALAILAVVLVAGGVASFIAIQGSPIQAVQARCADVSNGDWSDFYTHSTPDLQGQFGPEDQFVANQQQYVSSHGGVVSCTITTLNQQGSTATGTVVVTYGDGSLDTFDFQEELVNGGWELSQDVRRGG